MSIVQAIILALWYWVTTWSLGYTWGSAIFGDALVTGLVVGIVMGDVPTAMKCA
ncbi:MAG: PTS sugar transporter subunit IIC, partial [Clostridiales bacterium]|nr:PTS sugar transporter subunit IIC [Clostridiales bacterium]